MDETPKNEKKANKQEANKKNIIVSKYAEFKAEFSKIIWPTRETLLKKTVTVIFTSLIVGVVIALLDSMFAIIFRGFASLVG